MSQSKEHRKLEDVERIIQERIADDAKANLEEANRKCRQQLKALAILDRKAKEQAAIKDKQAKAILASLKNKSYQICDYGISVRTYFYGDNTNLEDEDLKAIKRATELLAIGNLEGFQRQLDILVKKYRIGE